MHTCNINGYQHPCVLAYVRPDNPNMCGTLHIPKAIAHDNRTFWVFIHMYMVHCIYTFQIILPTCFGKYRGHLMMFVWLSVKLLGVTV